MKNQNETDVVFNIMLKTLNDLLKCDSKAIGELIAKRCECNQELAQHPNAPVLYVESVTYIGLLGVINAILADLEGGSFIHRIAACVDEDNNVISFVEYKQPELL